MAQREIKYTVVKVGGGIEEGLPNIFVFKFGIFLAQYDQKPYFVTSCLLIAHTGFFTRCGKFFIMMTPKNSSVANNYVGVII